MSDSPSAGQSAEIHWLVGLLELRSVRTAAIFGAWIVIGALGSVGFIAWTTLSKLDGTVDTLSKTLRPDDTIGAINAVSALNTTIEEMSTRVAEAEKLSESVTEINTLSERLDETQGLAGRLKEEAVRQILDAQLTAIQRARHEVDTRAIRLEEARQIEREVQAEVERALNTVDVRAGDVRHAREIRQNQEKARDV